MAASKPDVSQTALTTHSAPLGDVVAELSIYFWTYKAILLSVALLAPGLGYDTSTTLLAGSNKLVRWDAIYFVQKAQRGDIFEQEWAFGKGLSSVLRIFSGRNAAAGRVAIVGIIVSHLSHYLAMLFLYKIAELLLVDISGYTVKRHKVPFVAACLYIIAPSGIFLSAPYAEAPFAALNMLGFWLFLAARDRRRMTLSAGGHTMLAGVLFGLATVLRSNGLLSGLLFVADALGLGIRILGDIYRKEFVLSHITALLATIMSGLCVAVGLILPQYVAYIEYCVQLAEPRPWCQNALPLIYSFVQSFYWNVGFLRYWTMSNLPLFLLASPALYLLIKSCIVTPSPAQQARLLLIAIPQLVLTLLAITNYHVQVITRLASGYPVLYIWLAAQLCNSRAQWTVRYFVLYGMIQAGLFASFLPPA